MNRLQGLRDLEEGSFEPLGLWAGHSSKPISLPQTNDHFGDQMRADGGGGGGGRGDSASDAVLAMAREASWSRSCIDTAPQALPEPTAATQPSG